MEETKPSLQFNSFHVIKVLFNREPTFQGGEFSINVSNGTSIDEKDPNQFFTKIVTEAKSEDDKASILVEAFGHFTLLGNPDENIKANFINISAPSIIYPYIRAFVSNLTLQSGMNFLTLPTVNFASIATQQPPAQQTNSKE